MRIFPRNTTPAEKRRQLRAFCEIAERMEIEELMRHRPPASARLSLWRRLTRWWNS